jgi:hypothetical protein
MESYLANAMGDSVDNVSLHDIQRAIADIQEMDEEHGAFWVSIVEEEETVLETQKDLTVIGIFQPSEPGDKGIRKQMKNWAEVERLYALFLDQNFDAVKKILSEP